MTSDASSQKLQVDRNVWDRGYKFIGARSHQDLVTAQASTLSGETHGTEMSTTTSLLEQRRLPWRHLLAISYKFGSHAFRIEPVQLKRTYVSARSSRRQAFLHVRFHHKFEPMLKADCKTSKDNRARNSADARAQVGPGTPEEFQASEFDPQARNPF